MLRVCARACCDARCSNPARQAPANRQLWVMRRLSHVAQCVGSGSSSSPSAAASPAAAAAAPGEYRATPHLDDAYFARESWSGASTRPQVAASLARAYAEHGFIVAKSLFPQDMCLAMEAELLRFQAGEFDEVSAIDKLEAPLPRDELLGRYMYIFQPHAASALVREWMVDRRLREVLGSIIGAHIPGWDGGFKCMQSMFVLRKPGAPGSPWHQVLSLRLRARCIGAPPSSS